MVLRSYGLYLKTLLLLCSLAFLFYACDQDENISDKQREFVLPPDSERIPVNFSVSENAFTDDAEENPVKTRSIAYLKPGSYVRIVAYIILSGDTIYNGDYADYAVMSGSLLNPLVNGLTIYHGLTYKFVAYSFDNTIPFSSPFAPVTGAIPPQLDIMWGDTIETITPSHSTIHITMNHLTSKVTVVATALPSGLISNTIDTIRGAAVAALLPSLNIKTGEFVSTSPGYAPVSWPAGSASTRTSNVLYPSPNGANNTQLRIEQLEINGINYVGPFILTYSKPLEAGKTYTLQVYMHYAHGGSADRITIDDTGSSPKLAITRNPNDFGLFFKFGGVVGMNSSDTNFSLSTIVYNPLGPLATPISGYGTDVLPGVPGYTGSDANIHSISSNDYHHLANVLQGKGDPCRLVGMTVSEIIQFADDEALYAREEALKSAGIGGWRLPTVLDNQRFIDIDPIPSGYTLHFWGNASGGVIPSPFGNPPVDGAEFPYRNSLNGSPNPAKFLPATGRRDTNGSLIYATQSGYYWSDIPAYGSFQRTALFFANGGVINSTSSDQYYASAVRCVHDDQSGITLSVEDWGNGGTLGTGGDGDIVLP